MTFAGCSPVTLFIATLFGGAFAVIALIIGLTFIDVRQAANPVPPTANMATLRVMATNLIATVTADAALEHATVTAIAATNRAVETYIAATATARVRIATPTP